LSKANLIISYQAESAGKKNKFLCFYYLATAFFNSEEQNTKKIYEIDATKIELKNNFNSTVHS